MCYSHVPYINLRTLVVANTQMETFSFLRFDQNSPDRGAPQYLDHMAAAATPTWRSGL